MASISGARTVFLLYSFKEGPETFGPLRCVCGWSEDYLLSPEEPLKLSPQFLEIVEKCLISLDSPLPYAKAFREGEMFVALSYRPPKDDPLLKGIRETTLAVIPVRPLDTVAFLGPVVVFAGFPKEIAEELLPFFRMIMGRPLGSLIQIYMETAASSSRTLRTLTLAIDGKDPFTALHSMHVAEYAKAMACEIWSEYGLTDEDIKILYIAELVHDAGKIESPYDLLWKPHFLYPPERQVICLHAETSASILGGIPSLEKEILFTICLLHHPHVMDGFPEEMRILGALLVIADRYDAMRSYRPYRHSLGRNVTEQEVRRTAREFGMEGVANRLVRVLHDLYSERYEPRYTLRKVCRLFGEETRFWRALAGRRGEALLRKIAMEFRLRFIIKGNERFYLSREDAEHLRIVGRVVEDMGLPLEPEEFWEPILRARARARFLEILLAPLV